MVDCDGFIGEFYAQLQWTAKPRCGVALVVFGALLLVGAPTVALYNSLNAAGIHPGAKLDQVIQNADGTVSYLFSMPTTTTLDWVWPGAGVLIGLLVIALGAALLLAKPKPGVDAHHSYRARGLDEAMIGPYSH